MSQISSSAYLVLEGMRNEPTRNTPTRWLSVGEMGPLLAQLQEVDEENVEAAFSELRRAGLVERQGGVGFVVTDAGRAYSPPE